MEKRALLAAVISAVVLFLWFAIFPPPKSGEPQRAPAEVSKDAREAATPSPVGSEAVAVAEEVKQAIGGAAEERIELEGDGWRAVLSSRGAVVRSLVLSEYRDEAGQPLELVGREGPAPLEMAAAGPWNDALYSVERGGSSVILRWSDGNGSWVEKRVAAGKGRYGVEVEVAAGGRAGRDGVVVAVGRDVKGAGAAGFATVGAVTRVAGEMERLAATKLENPKELKGEIAFAGVEDHYFLMVLLPEERLETVRAWSRKGDAGPVAVLAALPGGGTVRGTLYAGPKEHRVLTAYGRSLDETLSFGLFGIFSVGFLAVMRWIHSWASNWGVAIILLTAAIRLLLFPLTHKATVAMRRMQALQPKMKAIQDRYQERAKRDPQARQRMNQEVMGLYKQEGVNPMGGCLPTLVQLPILWALYTLFANAIELRQAPFFLWVKDLSLPDTLFTIPFGGGWDFPFRPLALLMGGSMWLQQKLAPQVGDPTQRRIFMMMPILFTVMFYGFPSGLVLYWLVNNVLTIAQQLITERLLRDKPAAA